MHVKNLKRSLKIRNRLSHIPKISKKFVKICVYVFGVFLLLIISVGGIAFSKRQVLLNKLISKAINKAAMNYDLDLKIESSRFIGLSKVHLANITVVPKQRDTLITIKELTVEVKLAPLLVGKVKLSEVGMQNSRFSIVLKDSLTNLDFFLKRKKRDSSENKSKLGLNEIAGNLMNEVFYKIPKNMAIKRFLIQLNDNDTAKISFLTTTATIHEGYLQSTIKVNDTASTWHLNGKLNPARKKLNVMLFADGEKVELPYLERKYKVKLSFDTVMTEIKEAGDVGNNYKISGFGAIKNLLINQKRLSATDIVVSDAKIEANFLAGKNYLALDSSSVVMVKGASLHPYLKYTLSPNKIYELKLNAEEQDAQTVFDAFPAGLFESLDGMKVQGKLKYRLDFYLDSAQPEKVKFDSRLTPNGFKILKYGEVDLQKINREFVYTPYEYGKPMRNIIIGPSNHNYTPLNQISKDYIDALLTAEDPSFYRHKGFVEESFRKSIVVNFKEKRFVRGGSTISMQLVKNVFLHRNKTIVRKLEEVLIVWLIENNRLVSKSRILEVYFNIIEMGQNVYGIGEASKYYFAKTPAELTLGEGLYLASINPKPKTGLYKFDPGGYLKPYMLKYFNFMGNLMARKGIIPADSSGYGYYDVCLQKGLRKYLAPDTSVIDTSKILDNDEEEMTPLANNREKTKSLLERLFGSSKKVDTVKSIIKIDSIPKTKKQLRQERTEQRQREQDTKKINNAKNTSKR